MAPGTSPPPLMSQGIRSSVICFALAALIVTSGCGRGDKNVQASAGPQAMPVAMQTLTPTDVQDAAEYVSMLKSRNSSTVSPQVEGVITKIFVKSGDRVSAGEPLIQIDPLKQEATTESQLAALKSKEADTAYAETQLNRTRQLYQAGVTSKRSEEHTSELQSHSFISYAVFCLKKKQTKKPHTHPYLSAPSEAIVATDVSH